ncbi:NAD(P)-dependent oxidoreductase [Aliagarivorans taiwanensis]|uniref:NAD(P)-dependent oxidoreductase n=1 Tax=Aliagarivorans taiwanensis TaxID=561966 RepID=UPI000412CCD5|nr:NAD(P)-dependent oxidoreductase [Aliagarivorans taiwanensis]
MGKKLAFIGLGTMGYPMAGHLQQAGYQVCVYNRTGSKAEAWCEQYGGSSAATPAGAAKDADIVFSCVGNDQDVRSVYYGEQGIIAGARAGAVLVDHTTASAELAVELAQAAADAGLQFLDAPVSGGQAGAENGCLTVMVGGAQATLAKVEAVMDSYAQAITLVGEHGKGQLCKMVNQLCIAGILQGLSEGLQLASKTGLDVTTLVEVLKHGAAGSWQLENRAENVAKGHFDYGFAIDWMRKDLGICLEQASQLGLSLPLAEQVDQRYAELQQRGFGRSDTSVLYKQFDQEHHD